MAEKKSAENVIFVGVKPVMNYVMAVITQFNEGFNEVVLKARGKAISRAVDAAEIVRNRFMSGLNIGSINISTEKMQGERGETNVSTIEITLKK